MCTPPHGTATSFCLSPLSPWCFHRLLSFLFLSRLPQWSHNIFNKSYIEKCSKCIHIKIKEVLVKSYKMRVRSNNSSSRDHKIHYHSFFGARSNQIQGCKFPWASNCQEKSRPGQPQGHDGSQTTTRTHSFALEIWKSRSSTRHFEHGESNCEVFEGI